MSDPRSHVVDSDNLRHELEYVESHIRQAMVSSFARLLDADPAAAKERLAAVNAKTNLTAHLIRDGASNPEHHFFAAADHVFRFPPADRPTLDDVTEQMTRLGASEDDVASVRRVIDASPDLFASREFETFAGAQFHCTVIRRTLDAGARIGLVDPTLTSATMINLMAKRLAGAADLADAAQSAGAAPNVPSRVDRAKTSAGIGAEPRAAARAAAREATAAFGTALDEAHQESPVPRRPPLSTSRHSGRPVRPSR